MTDSRELTRFCQESVRPESSSRMNLLLNNTQREEVVEFISEVVLTKSFDSDRYEEIFFTRPGSI